MTTRGRWRAAVGIVGLVASACQHPVPAPIETPLPTPVLREEAMPPSEQPQLEIVDLQETPSADKKLVTLTGTLHNRGTGATHQLLVRVEARDQNDAVLLSADATPGSTVVQPGDTTTFTVTVENRRDVSRYHVETLAR